MTKKNENLTDSEPMELSPMLCAVRDSLNKQIIECNAYLTKRNDMGQTHRPDDKSETISYTRGKSVGLIIARDEINKLLNG